MRLTVCYSYFEQILLSSLLWHNMANRNCEDIWQNYKEKSHLEHPGIQYGDFKNSSKDPIF